MQELMTLAPGARKRRFRADIRAGEYVKVETGRRGSGTTVSWQDYKRMVAHFRGKGFFPLGKQVGAVKPGGLGEYFTKELRKSPGYASHYAAVMVYLKDAKVVKWNPLTFRIV